jgi:hypothetical protein
MSKIDNQNSNKPGYQKAISRLFNLDYVNQLI